MRPRHVMIRASAGSGKTYALTSRYVALLAQGAPPERIVALTFTRKAAGEFFDEILHKLAGAAADADRAARLAREIGQPQLTAADFLRLLRAVVTAMPRLRLGTLDGFFGRIARVFPLELGLAGEFEILQEHAARLERRRVLQRMFAGGPGPGGLAPAQQEFIEAFKRATFGTEEKRLAARLDRFLDEHHEKFLAAPAGELWGQAARIWPDGCEWLEPVARPLPTAVEALRARLAGRELNEKQRVRWEVFFAALAEWSPGAPWPEAIEYVLKNTLQVWPGVRRGQAELTVERRKVSLGSAECADLAAIVLHLVGAELRRRLETTQGIHAVLAAYEAVYHDAVRREGRLTFADVQRLLLPETSGETLARDGGDGAGGRLLIDFRLDAQFDHWLLDEFQDTSFGQWRVLENLIDEAVQDPEGKRSFFCVGDVKQAIFTWREGDPRLFRDILERYNRAAPGTIIEEHLVQSYRSAPAIIEMVNAVFGRGEKIAELLPGPASAAWNREWRDHESARPDLVGHAAWLHEAEETDRLARVVALLQAIAPWERGLECAVLVQTNAMATAVAEYLRQEGGIPAMTESDLHVGIDNPLGVALLALVQAAAHPGDTLAQAHVAMTPLGEVLTREGLGTPDALSVRVLSQIHAEGFERTLEYWVRRLEPSLAPDDVFSRERGRQLVAAAALYDATGSREAAEFVAFVQRHTLRSVEMAGVVRVMTIHKSKGLGFDLVIVPDLEGERIDQRRSGLAVQRASDRTVEWVLDLPSKLVVAQEPILSAHVAAAEAEAGYEALALLYVGLTRAKRAMYVITKSPGKSESRNYPKLLALTLGDEPWSAGRADWFESVHPATPVGPVTESQTTRDWVPTGRAPRRQARRASADKGGVVVARQLLSLEGSSSRGSDFGAAVHALLAEVEWQGEPWPTTWPDRGLPADVVSEALACVEAPALAAVWRRPAAGEAWRERAFEIVIDGSWVTGVFDRVVVVRGPDGRVRAATVFDFKTDHLDTAGAIEAALDRHRGQLNLYRRVAAVMTGLPVAEVGCEVVFTTLRRSVTVPWR